MSGSKDLQLFCFLQCNSHLEQFVSRFLWTINIAFYNSTLLFCIMSYILRFHKYMKTPATLKQVQCVRCRGCYANLVSIKLTNMRTRNIYSLIFWTVLSRWVLFWEFFLLPTWGQCLWTLLVAVFWNMQPVTRKKNGSEVQEDNYSINFGCSWWFWNCLLTWLAIKLLISSSVSELFGERTTYATGTSPASASGNL